MEVVVRGGNIVISIGKSSMERIVIIRSKVKNSCWKKEVEILVRSSSLKD